MLHNGMLIPKMSFRVGCRQLRALVHSSEKYKIGNFVLLQMNISRKDQCTKTW